MYAWIATFVVSKRRHYFELHYYWHHSLTFWLLEVLEPVLEFGIVLFETPCCRSIAFTQLLRAARIPCNCKIEARTLRCGKGWLVGTETWLKSSLISISLTRATRKKKERSLKAQSKLKPKKVKINQATWLYTTGKNSWRATNSSSNKYLVI